MTDTSLARGDNKINQILKALFAYYNDRDRKLIDLLYKNDITQQEIADALGVTKQAISMSFPKGGENNEVSN